MKHCCSACCGDSRLRRSLITKSTFENSRSLGTEVAGTPKSIRTTGINDGYLYFGAVTMHLSDENARINYSSVRRSCIPCWCRWYECSQKGAQFVTDDIAIFGKYRIVIVSKLKSWYRTITSWRGHGPSAQYLQLWTHVEQIVRSLMPRL